MRVSADFTGVDKSTSGRIVRRVSQAIATLRPHFIKFPITEEEVEKVRQGFYQIAKFPRCIGAIDCTHVKIRSPGETVQSYIEIENNFFRLMFKLFVIPIFKSKILFVVGLVVPMMLIYSKIPL